MNEILSDEEKHKRVLNLFKKNRDRLNKKPLEMVDLGAMLLIDGLLSQYEELLTAINHYRDRALKAEEERNTFSRKLNQHKSRREFNLEEENKKLKAHLKALGKDVE